VISAFCFPNFSFSAPPARALAAETLTLERTLSDLNQAYALTSAEIALMWQTAPPRMPIVSVGLGIWCEEVTVRE
jgi:hypothetical protein